MSVFQNRLARHLVTDPCQPKAIRVLERARYHLESRRDQIRVVNAEDFELYAAIRILEACQDTRIAFSMHDYISGLIPGGTGYMSEPELIRQTHRINITVQRSANLLNIVCELCHQVCFMATGQALQAITEEELDRITVAIHSEHAH